MSVVGIIRVVSHGIVYVSALMVKKLGIRHHCGVLEVLPKASSDKVDMDPSNILPREIFHIKELRIFGCYFEELILLSQYFLPFFEDVALDPLILNEIELVVLPKDDVVDFLGEVSDQMKPLRLLPLLVLEEEVGEEYPILPV